MPHTLFEDKAELLKGKVQRLGQALQMIDNTELDLAPEANRVAVCNVALGPAGTGVFSGQAEFHPDGQLLSIGVRQRNGAECRDLIVKREAGCTRVTERRYFQGQSVTLTVHAVFGLAGELRLYEELF